jgi:Cu/Ag efflux pump CusA
MIRKIIELSIQFRNLVAIAALALVLLGANQIQKMSFDVFPEFAPPLVEVQTDAVGLSTEEVESLVTQPLELAFAGIANLETLRSKSVPGLSAVVLIFNRGTDLIEARQLVQERLAAVKPLLPNVARPPIILQPLSATSRVMKVGLSSKEMSLVDLSEVYRWKIRPRLMSLKGVANVAAWGARKRQLQIQVDPERARALGVPLDDILETAGDALDVGLLPHRKQFKTQPGGFIEIGDKRLDMEYASTVISPATFASMPINGSGEGHDYRLDDVAKIVEGHPPLIGDGIVNDGPGLLLIVEKFPWANTLEVTSDVEAAFETLKPGLPGIAVDTTIFRPATFIEASLENLKQALVMGSILVVVVIFLFMQNWRAAVISLFAIPISLLASMLVLHWFGSTINTMILAGFAIALGSVVDDAIIDIENIVRRLRENRLSSNPRSTARVVIEASLEIRMAVVYATLIIVLSVAPVLFLDGLSGAFFRPLTMAYILALFASMIVALTITPAMSLLLLSPQQLKPQAPRLVLWLQAGYARVLAVLMRTPKVAYLVTAAFLILGGATWPFLGQTLLPDFKERDFLMHWVTKPGTSYDEMARITIKASEELRKIDGVRNFGAHIGRAVASDEVVGINSASRQRRITTRP